MGKYNAKKGFCDDLDEGKFSFPLVHCFRSLRSGSPQWKELGLELQNTFMTRAQAPAQGLHRQMKTRVLEIMQITKSLAYTKEALQALEKELERLLGKMEAESGVRNELFKEYFGKVKV
jgi:septal ring factor EnvC (AmiA/AmiB activator)